MNEKNFNEVEKNSNIKIIVCVVVAIIILVIGIAIGLTIKEDKKTVNNDATNNNTNDNTDIVSKIEYEKVGSGNVYFMVYGYDDTGKEIWSYKTKQSTDGQYSDLHVSEEKDGNVYLFELGIVTALDKNTGNIVWKNSNISSKYYSKFVVGNNGYVYILAPIGKELFIIDKNGKDKKIDMEVEGVLESMDIDESKNQIVIHYDEPNSDYVNILTMNLSDYSYDVKKEYRQ